MLYGTEALYWRLTSTTHIRSLDAARRYELRSAIRRHRQARRDRKRTDRRRGLAVRRIA